METDKQGNNSFQKTDELLSAALQCVLYYTAGQIPVPSESSDWEHLLSVDLLRTCKHLL